MAATKEYLKRRAEYNIAHTKFLFTTKSPYGPPHKDTIARWVKNTLTQAGVNTDIFSSHSCRSSASSKANNMGVDLDNIGTKNGVLESTIDILEVLFQRVRIH